MSISRGIVSYGAYIPYWRLRREAIGATLGGAGGAGQRSVASYDEDTTSMAVEAGRIALASAPPIEPNGMGSVLFATACPAYADKTNATAIAAALSLGPDVLAADLTGAVRSGCAALHAGLRGDSASLVLLSDLRTGRPGSAEERDGGDGAAALVLGSDAAGPLIADYLGGASASDEFLDRWRSPGEASSRVWEERFGEAVYIRLAMRALTGALQRAGLSADEVDHVVVAGLHTRAIRGLVKAAKLRRDQLTDDLAASVGNTGTAQPGIALASVLDVAAPSAVIALVVLADGADVFLFRTTGQLPVARAARPVAAQIAAGRDDLPYATFLTWRGYLEREPPRRPSPDRPAAPPAYRLARWKFGLTGSTCECGQRHLPPQRACVSCGLADHMHDEPLSGARATVATYTVDHLAFSMSPPVIAAVLDFDGGGRFACELTDVAAADVAVGHRVEMTFRRLYTADGVHNYFWKARPVTEEGLA